MGEGAVNTTATQPWRARCGLNRIDAALGGVDPATP